MEDNDLEVIWWPAQSPDLNPIEHLWFYVRHKLQEYEVLPKGAYELWLADQVQICTDLQNKLKFSHLMC